MINYFKNKTSSTINISITILLVLLVAAGSSCTKNTTQTVTTLTKLVTSDEFSTDGSPDPKLWSYDTARGPSNDGWGNNELQYYTNRPDNVKVENGMLVITAKQENYKGAQYTSGRIVTKTKSETTYGRYEARIKLPSGKGIWPAFWLLGANCAVGNGPGVVWPQCGEIDIMELKGSNPATIQGTVHGNGYSGGNAITKSFTIQNDRFDNDFHIFGIEWAPGYINFYVDDKLYNQITPANVPGEWVFDHPFYILLNLAVGGNFDGNPNANTIFPQTMLVDYVRIYN